MATGRDLPLMLNLRSASLSVGVEDELRSGAFDPIAECRPAPVLGRREERGRHRDRAEEGEERPELVVDDDGSLDDKSCFLRHLDVAERQPLPTSAGDALDGADDLLVDVALRP